MEEVKKIIDIQFNGKQSIADVKKEISQLKKELDECAVGSKAAQEKSLELAQAQEKLKAAMKGAIDETGKLDQSYNGLVNRMAQLKAAQKQIDISTKEGKKQFMDYAKEINGINDKLKEMDSANGVWVRNVGNYASALGGVSGQVQGLIGTLNTLKTTMKALKLSMGWIGILIAAVAGGIALIVKAFKQNEQAVEKLKVAIAPLQGIMNAITNVLTKITDIISNGLAKALDVTIGLAEKLVGLFGGTEWTDRMREAKEIEEETQSLENDRIKLKEKEAKAEKELVKLRSDFKKYRNDEKKAAQIALEIEQKRVSIAQQNVNIAQREYDLIVKKNAQTRSTRAELEAEADALVKLNQAQGELNKSAEEWERIIRNGNTELSKTLILQRLEEEERKKRNLQETIEQKKRLLEQNQNNIAQRVFYQKQIDELELQFKPIQDTIDDLNGQLAEINKQAAIKAEEERQELIKQVKEKAAGLEDYILAYFSFNVDRVEKLTTAQLRHILDNIEEAFDADADKLTERIVKKLETALQPSKTIAVTIKPVFVDETEESVDDDAVKRGNAIRKRIQDTVDAYNYETQSIKEQYEQQYSDLEKAHETGLLSDKEFYNAKLNLHKWYLNEQAALIAEETAKYTAIADAIGSVLGSVADMWEESINAQIDAGEISQEEGEKQFENLKALQIAASTINTISGAIGAFMQANTSLPFPWGAIIGAIEAAAVTASGVAEIVKIKNTTLSSAGSTPSAGAASFQLPSLESYTPNYTQNLTGASDVDIIGKSVKDAIESAEVRAYVVEADITNAQKKSIKRVSETTW